MVPHLCYQSRDFGALARLPTKRLMGGVPSAATNAIAALVPFKRWLMRIVALSTGMLSVTCGCTRLRVHILCVALRRALQGLLSASLWWVAMVCAAWWNMSVLAKRLP